MIPSSFIWTPRGVWFQVRLEKGHFRSSFLGHQELDSVRRCAERLGIAVHVLSAGSVVAGGTSDASPLSGGSGSKA